MIRYVLNNIHKYEIENCIINHSLMTDKCFSKNNVQYYPGLIIFDIQLNVIKY